MTADELRKVAYQNPFHPFRVRLRSGELLEIKRTLRTTVLEDRVFFGVDEDPETRAARRLRIVTLNQIAEVEVAATS